VFAPCPSKRENQAAEPAFGTTPGKHQIEIIAWLPGTSIEFPAKATIELTCPSDLVEPAEEERRAPRKRRY
jgi:hypothetical protein